MYVKSAASCVRTIPGQFWIMAVYRDETGEALRFAHALVDAPNALAAANLPCVEDMVKRLTHDRPATKYSTVEVTVKQAVKAVWNDD